MAYPRAVFKEFAGEVQSVNEKARTIWHTVSREVEDRMGDVVRLAGISIKDFMKKPAVLYGHDYQSKDPVPVIGRNVGFEIDGDRLVAGTQFLDPAEVSPKLRDLIGDNWYLHQKKLLGWSIGFVPVEAEKILDHGQVVGVDYKRTELLEYSSVIIPANQDAVDNMIGMGLVTRALKDDRPGQDLGKPVYYYKNLEERELMGDRVRAAVEMLEHAMRRMKIPKVDLAWFKVCHPREPGARVLGPLTKAWVEFTRPPTIHIRADMSPAEVQLSAGHECHHVWLQSQPPSKFASLGADDREAAADACAFIMYDELRRRRGRTLAATSDNVPTWETVGR